jgi:hypothetical protein
MSGKSLGVRAVADVLERASRLADWLEQHKPSCKVITLTRRDYDLLLKHPSASGVTVNGQTAYWRTFELRAAPPARKESP